MAHNTVIAKEEKYTLAVIERQASSGENYSACDHIDPLLSSHVRAIFSNLFPNRLLLKPVYLKDIEMCAFSLNPQNYKSESETIKLDLIIVKNSM